MELQAEEAIRQAHDRSLTSPLRGGADRTRRCGHVGNFEYRQRLRAIDRVGREHRGASGFSRTERDRLGSALTGALQSWCAIPILDSCDGPCAQCSRRWKTHECLNMVEDIPDRPQEAPDPSFLRAGGRRTGLLGRYTKAVMRSTSFRADPRLRAPIDVNRIERAC